jgi:hypothetical protein
MLFEKQEHIKKYLLHYFEFFQNTSFLAKIRDLPAHKMRLQPAIFFFRQIVLGLRQW